MIKVFAPILLAGAIAGAVAFAPTSAGRNDTTCFDTGTIAGCSQSGAPAAVTDADAIPAGAAIAKNTAVATESGYGPFSPDAVEPEWVME